MMEMPLEALTGQAGSLQSFSVKGVELGLHTTEYAGSATCANKLNGLSPGGRAPFRKKDRPKVWLYLLVKKTVQRTTAESQFLHSRGITRGNAFQQADSPKWKAFTEAAVLSSPKLSDPEVESFAVCPVS